MFSNPRHHEELEDIPVCLHLIMLQLGRYPLGVFHAIADLLLRSRSTLGLEKKTTLAELLWGRAIEKQTLRRYFLYRRGYPSSFALAGRPPIVGIEYAMRSRYWSYYRHWLIPRNQHYGFD
jgi:hypothetical protein